MSVTPSSTSQCMEAKRTKLNETTTQDESDTSSSDLDSCDGEVEGSNELRLELLNKAQRQAFDWTAEGRSIFLTGSAGVGKTFVLQYIIQHLTSVHGAKHVFVTASTGMAASHLGGSTLHAYSGVGLGEGTVDQWVHRLQRYGKDEQWRETKVLIIDEISMITGEFLDQLEQLARKVRPRSAQQVFGGIQVIVAGDFFQLPPVSTPEKRWAFEADCWSHFDRNTVLLTEVMRQRDAPFIRILDQIRHNKLDEANRRYLESLVVPEATATAPLHNQPAADSTAMIPKRSHAEMMNGTSDAVTDEIIPTCLYPHRGDVLSENIRQLNQLPGQARVYTSVDVSRSAAQQRWLEQLLVMASLPLKRGAQVMYLRNCHGLFNGARGVVTEFVTVPVGVIPTIGPDKELGDWYRKHACAHNTKLVILPKVRFVNGRTVVIRPLAVDLRMGNRREAARFQLPLALAWSLTVHKSQGSTLDLVRASLGKAFGVGMIYVALSRVRNLEGLQLESFHAERIQTSPQVEEYYASLEERTSKAQTVETNK